MAATAPGSALTGLLPLLARRFGSALLTLLLVSAVIFTVSGTTVTVRDSYNVSSVTRNGTGDYSINFTTAFSSAWYCMACGATVNTAGTVVLFGFPNNLSAPTASVGRAIYVNSSGVAADPARVDISFFGDQ